jgi:phosphoglycerate dehydrogenase-like enzyme
VARIDTVVTTVKYSEKDLELLRRAFLPASLAQFRGASDVGFRQAVTDADVAVIDGDIDPWVLRAPRLRWVHIDKAGLDGSARPEVFARGLLVTGSSGRSDPALAEHVLYFMLSLAYNSFALHAAQHRRQWGIEGQEELRALHGRTVGILGLGHIGSAVARRCKAFGMRVLGYRRKDAPPPDGVDRVYATDRGENHAAILEESDFVVLALPLTDYTHGLIGADQFRRMKRSAFLINIARGALVNETALVEALTKRTLAGAGLDVFSVEPLPHAHPLWRTPNTLITPHVTPRLEDRAVRSIEIMSENVRRFRADEPLLNVLTARDIYTRRAPIQRRGDPARRLYRVLRQRFG